MEVSRAIEILDKALGRIPYKSVDLRLTLGDEEIELHATKHNPMGFLPVTAKPKEVKNERTH